MAKFKTKIILALLDLVLLAQQGTAFYYLQGHSPYNPAFFNSVGGEETESASRPYLRFGKRSTSNDDLIPEEESDNNNNILEDQDDNMMNQNKVNNFDEEKIKETSLPLNRPTRDAEFYEDPTNSDEGEPGKDSNEDRQTTKPLEEQWPRLTSFFYPMPPRLMARPARSKFIVRPTRSFMDRPTRAQFMVRPTRSFMNRPTRAQFMVRPTRSFMNRPTRAQFMVRPTRSFMDRPTRAQFMVRPTRSFMNRPTRAQFMVRPTRSFMDRPTRAQFMVRPTRASTAKRTEEVGRRSKDIFLMRPMKKEIDSYVASNEESAM